MRRKDDITISLIIPVYNSKNTIKRCLDSALSQTVQIDEIIVIDDGSTDGTCELVVEISKKHSAVHLLKQENSGVSSARNSGIKEATGDYVIFADADDELKKDAIEIILEDILGKNRPDIVKYGYLVKRAKGSENAYVFSVEKTEAVIRKNEFPKYIAPKMLLTNDFAPVWNMAIKSSIAKAVFFDKSIKCGEDRKYNADVIEKAETIYIEPKELYVYYITEGSATNSDKNKSFKRLADVLEVNSYIYEQMKGVPKQDLFESAMSDFEYYFSNNYGKYKYANYLDSLEKLKKEISKIEANSEVKKMIINTIEKRKTRASYYKNKIIIQKIRLCEKIRKIKR